MWKSRDLRRGQSQSGYGSRAGHVRQLAALIAREAEPARAPHPTSMTSCNAVHNGLHSQAPILPL